MKHIYFIVIFLLLYSTITGCFQEPKITKIYANIDTGGCFAKEIVANGLEGYGVLTALQFPEMKVFQQKNIDTQ